MATYTGHEEKDKSASNADLLLHPELLSQDFMKLMLSEKKIRTRDHQSRDGLTELYLRHVIPLPQRNLPDNRWGKKMEKSRARQPSAGERSNSNDHNRKRPPIVFFHGSSSHSGPLKVKKPEGSAASTAVNDRLKPPPSMNLANPVRKLSANTSSSSHLSFSSTETNDLKREADSSGVLKSPELKKRIQHVTWP